MEKRNEILPYVAMPAGHTLLREIKERGYSQKEFAEKLGMEKSNFNSLLKGKRGISPEIALQLENILGISANFWMELQMRYELSLARIKQKSTESITNALAVANYFISKSLKERADITMLKLLKMVYIANGYSLVYCQRPITSRFDRVEAWRLGPVIPSIYHSFKHNKNNAIKELSYIFKDNDFVLTEVEDKELMRVLDIVWDKYKNVCITDLINEVHQEGTPWSRLYCEGKNIEIPNQMTKAYYDEIL